jgi:hypothetical protein
MCPARFRLLLGIFHHKLVEATTPSTNLTLSVSQITNLVNNLFNVEDTVQKELQMVFDKTTTIAEIGGNTVRYLHGYCTCNQLW